MANSTAPAPHEQGSKAFQERWLSERGIDPSWGTFEPIATFNGAAFRIVTYDADGNPRPEMSRTRHDRADDKYMSPSGVGAVIYAPQPDSFVKFAAATEKWIAEGEGKALALAGLGLPVLGIGGVRSWHRKSEKRLHPDLAAHVRKDDVVNVAIDGDWQTNPAVAEGAGLLMDAIKAAGAIPQLVALPAAASGKVGIDDLIATWRREGKDVRAELDALPRLQSIQIPKDPAITLDADILAREPPQWIVKNLIPPGELTAIVGETSCGKTFLTIDLLLAVARGLPHWFGQRIKRTGLVVHITLEGTGLANRRRAYQQHHKLSGPLPYVAIEVPVNLRDPDTADSLIRSIRHAAREQPVVLIAVDTVNRALGGGDENSSVDMGAFLANAERLKSAFPGCGVLLVHHLGKDTSRGARGHSSFSANVGAELKVDADDKTGIRTVSITKQREGRTDAKFHFSLQTVALGHDDDGEEITSCVVLPSLAPVREADADNRTRYQWIYAWYCGEQNDRRPVSKRTLADNLLNIRPAKAKVTKAELQATLEWATDMGHATLAPDQPKNGARYVLQPLPTPKYA